MKYIKINNKILNLRHCGSFSFRDKELRYEYHCGTKTTIIDAVYDIKVKCDSVGKRLTKKFSESCSKGLEVFDCDKALSELEREP